MNIDTMIHAATIDSCFFHHCKPGIMLFQAAHTKNVHDVCSADLGGVCVCVCVGSSGEHGQALASSRLEAWSQLLTELLVSEPLIEKRE